MSTKKEENLAESKSSQAQNLKFCWLSHCLCLFLPNYPPLFR